MKIRLGLEADTEDLLTFAGRTVFGVRDFILDVIFNTQNHFCRAVNCGDSCRCECSSSAVKGKVKADPVRLDCRPALLSLVVLSFDVRLLSLDVPRMGGLSAGK